jgi:hypothetical protein
MVVVVFFASEVILGKEIVRSMGLPWWSQWSQRLRQTSTGSILGGEEVIGIGASSSPLTAAVCAVVVPRCSRRLVLLLL